MHNPIRLSYVLVNISGIRKKKKRKFTWNVSPADSGLIIKTKQDMQPQEYRQHPLEKHQMGQEELAQLEQPLFQHTLHHKLLYRHVPCTMYIMNLYSGGSKITYRIALKSVLSLLITNRE